MDVGVLICLLDINSYTMRGSCLSWLEIGSEKSLRNKLVFFLSDEISRKGQQKVFVNPLTHQDCNGMALSSVLSKSADRIRESKHRPSKTKKEARITSSTEGFVYLVGTWTKTKQ
ncbi:hypothetical protein Droror1_Dr00027759 [Drosera rotundifolia]